MRWPRKWRNRNGDLVVAMSFKRYGLGIILGMAISAAMAAAVEEGRRYYADKDYGQAWRVLLPLAKSGDAEAELLVADMYRQGLGVTPTEQEAIRWYRKAAESGLPEAQLAVAGAYFEGRTLPYSLEQAIAWWSRAASAGLAAAQYNLGLAYARALGTGRDDRAAREWFEKAAGQGHSGARFALGVMYAFGQGVERDVTKAAHWFQQAAEHGMPEAQYNVAALALAKADQERLVQEGQQSSRKLPEQRLTTAYETLANVRAQSAANGIKAESWIRARQPSQFTVQLATTTDEDSIIPFIKSQALNQDLTYFRVKGGSPAHYVIIYGVFETGQDARTALSQLPAQLLQAKPLVRSFRQVQEMMASSSEAADRR